jgi:hypothetical protein
MGRKCIRCNEIKQENEYYNKDHIRCIRCTKLTLKESRNEKKKCVRTIQKEEIEEYIRICRICKQTTLETEYYNKRRCCKRCASGGKRSDELKWINCEFK